MKGRLRLFDSQFSPADPFLQQLEGKLSDAHSHRKSILLLKLVTHPFLSAPVLS